jgi:hypothetical protein
MLSGLTPSDEGPRHAGQLAETAADPASSPAITTLAVRLIILRPSFLIPDS